MITKQNDELYMKRCIDLALMGKGNVEPNPLVGSVIVRNNLIIGEGYHIKYGDAHAEVNAINSVKDKKLLEDSILYVNLEPCSHFGKTPPCTNAIIKHKLPEVVIGTIDSNSEVAGKGIDHLEKNGVKVNLGVLENESKWINRRFFTFHEKKRPYIILKWAQSMDGFIDIKRHNKKQKGTWLTNEACRSLVHKWRAEESAILIGAKTALLDDPELNIRSWSGKNPQRVVIDKDGNLPGHLKVFNKEIATFCYSGTSKESDQNLYFKRINFSGDVISEILDDLYKKEVQSIIVEGGTETINSFYHSNLWDEIRLFIGNKVLNEGIKGPEIRGDAISRVRIGDSQLLHILNKTYL